MFTSVALKVSSQTKAWWRAYFINSEGEGKAVPFSDTAISQDLSKVITCHSKGAARRITEPRATHLGVGNTLTMTVFHLRGEEGWSVLLLTSRLGSHTHLSTIPQ